MLLRFQDPVKLKTKRVVYEENYYARDSGTLEQLKELSTKRQAIEESINGSSKITPAIAREMAGGITSPILQAVAIRKAEEKATSGSLLAKLHYGVVQFLEGAALLLRTSTADWNDISDMLRVS
ncbi:hypothetical protein KC19_8G191300 [Ceratodon purpureus]|uniref:Uncharacterized protein n=1 Tax=Ceratodon purpureus TaxID=3225 RepID=A0A8T0H2N9_CERPU|nr:hypothetical protein KC19_8G191300 [Ceratodon purpureus]